MKSFKNPVIPGFYPDPSVCIAGKDYYLVTSTFEYFPAVPIFHSTDLLHWTQIGHCLTRTSQVNLAGRPSSLGIFAPTIRYHEGTFYMITTDVSGAGHFFVTAKDPSGPWSDPIFVEGPGFDPDLFFDDDGKVYFSREDITGHGIRQQEIDISTGTLIGGERLIWDGLEDVLCEAPHIYKIDGMYYLLVAEGGTYRGHMAVIARGPNPWGPFVSCPHNPILTHRNRVLSSVQATGHGDLIQKEDGSWWMVFLATRPVGKWHHLGRETFLAPVRWEEGWPVVNDGNEITCSDEPVYEDQVDDVTCDGQLLMPWNVRGILDPRYIKIPFSHAGVDLTPSPGRVGDTFGSAFIGRRQRSFECELSATVTESDLKCGEEAGLTALANETHYYCIALSATEEGEREVIVRRKIGTLDTVTVRKKLPRNVIAEKGLRLSIRADRRWYYLQFNDPESGETILLDSAETRYLSTEVAGGFTGVYLGLYGSSSDESNTIVSMKEVRMQ